MISGNSFKEAILSAANNITNSRKIVDDMNIFPVPDGDTGTNMSMTISSAVAGLDELSFDRIDECAAKVASALLRGARGNSGVILSLLFRGISKGLKGMETADGQALADALALGVEAAYKAVMKPTEGTILTVARVAAEKAHEAAAQNNDALFVWEIICGAAHDALSTTPELLPVLKKAGVVDAGGKGLTLIFDGMLSVFRDGMIVEAIPEEPEEEEKEAPEEMPVMEWEGELTFTYCVEFLASRQNNEAPLSELKAYLESIGDRVVVEEDDDAVKVHVHTDMPGDALSAGLKIGPLMMAKVENLREQKRKLEEAAGKEKLTPCEPTEDYGFVSVSAGDGLRSLFTDLGCTHVVSGGQTMNPSTDDILEAVMATPAKAVYVLPNNKNIIMAAQQAAELVEDRKVYVVSTRTIPQGMAAMLVFDPEVSAEDNVAAMNDAAGRVATGQVTFAARDSDYDGHKITEGEIIALENGRLVFSDKTPVKAVVRLARSMVRKDSTYVTLICGEGISKEEAEEAQSLIEARLPSGAEFALIEGGQPVYYFILSVE